MVMFGMMLPLAKPGSFADRVVLFSAILLRSGATFFAALIFEFFFIRKEDPNGLVKNPCFLPAWNLYFRHMRLDPEPDSQRTHRTKNADTELAERLLLAKVSLRLAVAAVKINGILGCVMTPQ